MLEGIYEDAVMQNRDKKNNVKAWPIAIMSAKLRHDLTLHLEVKDLSHGLSLSLKVYFVL
jgi:hypothetical protein